MRRQPQTPAGQIRQALDRLWLRSRERSAALKRTGYCCELCGRKQSKRKGHECKIEVHHRDGCDRRELAELVRLHLLHDQERLVPLCVDCHHQLHANEETP